MSSIPYLALKCGVSILLPVGLSYVEPTVTLSIKTLIALCTFLVWSSFDALYYLRRLHNEGRRQHDLWLMEHDLDVVLNNIRRYYQQALREFYGPDDLFRDYFQRTFARLAESVKGAAEQKEILVVDFHFQRTELLLRAFSQDESAILRFVWILDRSEPLFDEKWKHYCGQIDQGVKKGAVKEVRALLVLRPGLASNDAVVRGLSGFYEFARNYDYRLLDQEHYDHIKADHDLGAEYVDFGIYGCRYIYRTISYGAVTSGRFCKDTAVIDRYTRFFDVAWNSQSAQKAHRSSLAKIKLLEMLSLSW